MPFSDFVVKQIREMLQQYLVRELGIWTIDRALDAEGWLYGDGVFQLEIYCTIDFICSAFFTRPLRRR